MRTPSLRLTILAVLIGAASSCISLVKPPKEAVTTYVLKASPETASPDRIPLPLVLYVPRASAPAYIDSTKILFNRDESTVSAYQFAQWAEPPPAAVTTLVIEAIERAGIFRAVTRQTSGAAPDIALNLEITDFRHDAAQKPGSVVFGLKAELTELRSAKVISSRRLGGALPVDDFSAGGAAHQMNRLAAQTLTELTTWVLEMAPVAPRRSLPPHRDPISGDPRPTA